MSTNLIGQTLLNQFRVEAFIAAGGMGAVYRVWDLQRNVPLAMKVLHADLAEDPTIFNLFQREANALKKLAHPNIVPFYGIYQSDDLVFLLQHFVDGYSLKEILHQHKGGPLPVDEVLVYLRALSAALGYAHVHGVVHCDVKPGNVMVDRGGNIYLADFGIARHAESTRTSLGGAGAPAYMAPEQIRGEAVTAATDVYATGVMLFEMLSGKRPFRGDEGGTAQSGATTMERIRNAHLNSAAPDLRSFNPNVSSPLSQAIRKAMAKEADQRYRSMGDLFGAACTAQGANQQQIPSRISLVGLHGKESQNLTDDRGQMGGSVPRTTESYAGGSAAVTQTRKRLSGSTLALILGGILVATLLAFLGINRGCASIPPTGPAPVITTELEPGSTVSPPDPTEDTTSTSPGNVLPPPDESPTETDSPLPTIETPVGETPTYDPPPPFGKNLAFTSINRNGKSNIILMDPEYPLEWEQLSPPDEYELVQWPSFCGELVAVEAQDTNGSNPQWIFLLSANGSADSWNPPGSPAQLGVPRCSPDGNYLSYSANISGNWEHTIADFRSGGEILSDNLDLSPSGYASWFLNNRDFLWMGRNEQGAFISLLTENLQISNTDPLNPRMTEDGDDITQWRHPAISPNGDQVAFNCLVRGDDEQEATHICIAGINSSSARKLFKIEKVDLDGYWEQVNPVWSRDGEWIYFNSADGGDWDILRIRPDGSNLENLTEAWGDSDEFHPATRW